MIGVVCALLVSHLLSSEAKHMSWQHFKQTWLIKFWAPAPAVIAAGILSTYYFGITGTFWAVTGRLPAGAGKFCSFWRSCRTVGLLQADSSGRYAADAYRRHDDPRHVRRLFRRGAVGQQRKTAYAAQPNPYRTGGGRRHYRWLRRASGDGV